jgi:hypothetical protein
MLQTTFNATMFYLVSLYYRDIFYDGTRACPECITSESGTSAKWDKPDKAWSLQSSPESVVVCFCFFVACGGLNAYRGAFAQRRGVAAAKLRALMVQEQEKQTAKLQKRLAQDLDKLDSSRGMQSSRDSGRRSAISTSSTGH